MIRKSCNRVNIVINSFFFGLGFLLTSDVDWPLISREEVIWLGLAVVWIKSWRRRLMQS